MLLSRLFAISDVVHHLQFTGFALARVGLEGAQGLDGPGRGSRVRGLGGLEGLGGLGCCIQPFVWVVLSALAFCEQPRPELRLPIRWCQGRHRVVSRSHALQRCAPLGLQQDVLGTQCVDVCATARCLLGDWLLWICVALDLFCRCELVLLLWICFGCVVLLARACYVALDLCCGAWRRST